MDLREKLVALIGCEVVPYFAERIADRLIVNGVTLQDCELLRIKTNADRIRTMSDEELAEQFWRNSLCKHIQTEHPGHCEMYGACSDCVRDWLRQPIE